MDTQDQQVLQSAVSWLSAGHRLCLFTVLKTWGSAPRQPGAWLVIRSDGALRGSVSGGCIEDELIARIRQGELLQGMPQRLQFGVTADQAKRMGLPCGGRLEVLAEPLSASSDWLAELAERLSKGQGVRRHVDLSTGRVSLQVADTPFALHCNDHDIVSFHGPRWRLFVVGAGQISQYLIPMAVATGFDVMVCDPRSEYTVDWSRSDARLLTGMPDDELLAIKPDQRCAVVALTHDPKLDDLVLIDALQSDAFYVGALGSAANQSKRKDRLMTHFGLTEEHFSRLHGPIGLRIGSRTPPEIAVSVMAEIIAEKNRLVASATP